MSKKTFNLLVATIIFAIPIVCGFQVNKTSEENCVERVLGPIRGKCRFDASEVKEHMGDGGHFAQRCKSISGVDIDLERNDRLYEEYAKCVNDLVDPKQFNRAFGSLLHVLSTATVNTTLSDQHNSAILATVEKYCPVVSNVVRCDEKLLPIYSECFRYWRLDTLTKYIWISSFDFFCGNDAENAITFINEKFIDFVLKNSSDISECDNHAYEIVGLEVLSGDPDAECNWLQHFTNCLIQKTEKLPSSEAFRTFAATASTYIKANTCANFANATRGYPRRPIHA